MDLVFLCMDGVLLIIVRSGQKPPCSSVMIFAVKLEFPTNAEALDLRDEAPQVR